MEHDDKDLKAFDWSIQNQTSHIITKLISKANGSAGSLDSLILIIGCLGDTNQEVVRVLLKSKRDIRGSKELLELLLDYFRCSHKTLDFLNTLHAWLHGASGVSYRLNQALQEFKSDKTKTGFGRALLHRALNGFLGANDPLVAEHLRANLRSVFDEQTRLYERFKAKKEEVENRTMKQLLVYRKVTTAVLTSVYMGLVVCAAVTAVMSPALVVPPLAVLAAIATMNPTEHTSKWMNHLWGKYEDKVRRRSELVNALMGANCRMTVEDLEGIRLVVHTLRDKVQSFEVNLAAAVNLRNDSVLKIMIQDMECRINEFSRAVKDLESKKNKCYKDVMNARAKIFGAAFGNK